MYCSQGFENDKKGRVIKYLMNFKEILEEFKVLRKFHTSDKDKDTTIFFRGKDNLGGSLVIVSSDKECVFDLEKISLMSLSKHYGLLIHYDDFDNRRVCPYRFDDIIKINVNMN